MFLDFMFCDNLTLFFILKFNFVVCPFPSFSCVVCTEHFSRSRGLS